MLLLLLLLLLLQLLRSSNSNSSNSNGSGCHRYAALLGVLLLLPRSSRTRAALREATGHDIAFEETMRSRDIDRRNFIKCHRFPVLRRVRGTIR